MLHLLIDTLRNSILITGLVVVMMMMIESLNIESRGSIFKGLRRTRIGQVVVAALLGSVPGCMGGFAVVSLYTHRLFSFGALTAMMIATSGDEAFLMLAMIPDEALKLFALLLVIAVFVGITVDFIHEKAHKRHCDRQDHSDCGAETSCPEGYVIHEQEISRQQEKPHKEESKGKKRHYGWKRMTMFIGLAIFITALATGGLSHSHSHPDVHEHHHHSDTVCEADHTAEAETSHIHQPHIHLNLLNEEWMNILFAGLSIIVLFVLMLGSDHFVEQHLWHHIVRKHLPTIFAWTFGVLLVVGIGLQYIDIQEWVRDNTVLMILLATVIGIIPESGPHIVFLTLFSAGIIPFPVLLANSISQDGHASIPLLAESKKSFLWAKIINCTVAIAVGLTAMLFI